MRFLKNLFGSAAPKAAPHPVLSSITDNDALWAELEEAAQKRRPVECHVEWANQYGVLVSYHGIETYVGRRYLALKPEQNHRDLVGQNLPFAVREASRRGKLLLTRQPLAAAEKRVAIARKLKNVALGEEVSGYVIEVNHLKAIVRLDDYPEAKAVINRTSLKRRFVADMADEFAVGDEVDAIVTGTKPERATLYICPMEFVQDPWESIDEHFHVGDIIAGTITTCAKYGVFVEIATGVTGLVRTHDLDWTRVDPLTFGKTGDQIRVVILDIDPVTRKIALSRKHAMADPRKEFAESHQVGDELEGAVANITDFGLFVEVKKGVQGLLHINHLDLDNKEALQARHPCGSKIRVRVLSIEDDGARIGLVPA